MPTITINTNTLTFNNIYYVTSSGLDTNPGTSISPLKTVYAAVTKCASSGDAIYISDGTYDVTYVSGGYGCGGLYDYGKSISFIGKPGKTIFTCDGTKNANRDQHLICTYGTQTKIYDIIFKGLDGTSRTNTNYANAICGRDATNTNAQIYNCVFDLTANNHNYSFSMIYDNNSSSNIVFNNCSFKIGKALTGSYSGAARWSITNCSFDYTYASEGGSYSNNITSTVYDSQYKITSPITTTIGVYKGSYSWTTYKYLIDDNGALKISNSGTDTTQVGSTPYTDTIFTTKAMDSLSYITPTVINMINSQKYKISMFKK